MAPLVTDLDGFPAAKQGGIVSIGNFDGVHRGHTRIAARAAGWAAELGVPAVALTFDPHPAALLRPDRVPPPLGWIERRCELLGGLGIDPVVVCPTDRALLELEPKTFFERIIVDRLGARGLVEGENFRFGKGRRGTISVLKELADIHGIAAEVVEPCLYDDAPISSSRIRAAIEAGDVERATAMLGRPHRIRGIVVEGAKRGRQIGFPSANLNSIEAMLPAEGVYAGCAHHPTESFATAVNIGPNPTFGETSRKVEAHLIDFAGDLYGATLEIDFLERLRSIVSFGNVDALKQQIERDVENTRKVKATRLTTKD